MNKLCTIYEKIDRLCSCKGSCYEFNTGMVPAFMHNQENITNAHKALSYVKSVLKDLRILKDEFMQGSDLNSLEKGRALLAVSVKSKPFISKALELESGLGDASYLIFSSLYKSLCNASTIEKHTRTIGFMQQTIIFCQKLCIDVKLQKTLRVQLNEVTYLFNNKLKKMGDGNTEEMFLQIEALGKIKSGKMLFKQTENMRKKIRHANIREIDRVHALERILKVELGSFTDSRTCKLKNLVHKNILDLKDLCIDIKSSQDMTFEERDSLRNVISFVDLAAVQI